MGWSGVADCTRRRTDRRDCGTDQSVSSDAAIDALRSGEAGRRLDVVEGDRCHRHAEFCIQVARGSPSVRSRLMETGDGRPNVEDCIKHCSSARSTGAKTREISRNAQQAVQCTMRVSSTIAGVQRVREAGRRHRKLLPAALSVFGEQSSQARSRKILRCCPRRSQSGPVRSERPVLHGREEGSSRTVSQLMQRYSSFDVSFAPDDTAPGILVEHCRGF